MIAKNQESSFPFSIIMAVYNSEDYLEKSLNSIINQNLDFKRNVQLILVNDGSTDNSLEILNNFQNKYPDNIIVLNQTNMGQARARNNGLKHATGTYVNFLDSDDYLSTNTLKEVGNYFSKWHDEVDLIAIPQIFFDRQKGEHILNQKFTDSKIIDLNVDANNPQLSASSSFFKRDVLSKYQFDETLLVAEDAILVNKVLLEKKKYGLVNTATYYYRKRGDLTSTMDNASEDKRYFTEKLRNYSLELVNYSKKVAGDIPKFIQYTIVYDLQWILEQEDISILTTDEKKEFWKDLRHVLIQLDEDTFKDNVYIRNKEIENFLLYIKNGNFIKEFSEKNVGLTSGNYIIEDFSKEKVWIDIIEIRNDTLNISGYFNTHFSLKDIKLIFKARYNDKIREIKSKESFYTNRKNTTFLSKEFVYNYCFDVKIPLSNLREVTLDLVYDDNQNRIHVMPEVKFMPNAGLSTTSFYLVKSNKILSYTNGLFKLEEYSFKQTLKYELPILKKIIKDKKKNYVKNFFNRIIFFVSYPLIERFYHQNEIYLFMDRIDYADDNAEALYKYALNQEDDIRKYFILLKTSKDYSRLKKYANLVEFNSFKRKLLYIHADKIISSHPDEFILNPFFDNNEYITGMINVKKYFLQHGVTKDNISEWLRKYDKNLSLLLTVSDLERESFLEPGYNYDENIIQTLGFPRFDNLNNDNVKKQIVLMPSWRWMYDKKEKLFLESDYYKKLNDLLSNKELMNFLRKNDYKIVFKPHPLLNQFMDLFEIDEYVTTDDNKTYNELFNESSLLITDYSSVAFDFAYLKKPVIYYQYTDDYHFDLNKSYFKYESMGFGDVIKDENDLIGKIKYYVSNNSQMEDKYRNRVESFFRYNDNNNSKRVYDWIKKN